MPANRRQDRNQKLTSAYNEIIRSGAKLLEVAEIFKVEHPEITEEIGSWCTHLSTVAAAIQEFMKTV